MGSSPKPFNTSWLSKSYEHAADLIERYGPDRLEQSDPSVFQMADHLPREILITRPKIGLYQAWLLHYSRAN